MVNRKIVRGRKRYSLGQVWIETVIYTLIAFVMMGLILSYAKPKIEEIQDNALLKQSTEMLKEIDSTILTMGTAGNQRTPEVTIKKGSLTIKSVGDEYCFGNPCLTTKIITNPSSDCSSLDLTSCTDSNNKPYCADACPQSTNIIINPTTACSSFGLSSCTDSNSDKIIFEMDSKNIYSEPGRIINDGSVKVETVKKSGFNTVTLTLDYSEEYNIQFNGMEESKVISKSSTPYNLIIANSDPVLSTDKMIMNIKLG